MRTVALLVSAFLLGTPSASGDDSPKPRPPRPVVPAPADYDPYVFQGRVEHVSPDAVTIKPQGDMRIHWQSRHPDGTPYLDHEFVQDNAQPPRTFGYEDSLRVFCGLPLKVPPARLDHSAHSGEHKVTEVREGDVVIVSYAPLRGEMVVTWLRILRRPGGRVPDAVGDKDTTIGWKVSTRMNAHQFTEETVAGKWGPKLLAALKR